MGVNVRKRVQEFKNGRQYTEARPNASKSRKRVRKMGKKAENGVAGVGDGRKWANIGGNEWDWLEMGLREW
jgi:hypothetical protein